jgi:hypothetical protein
MTAPKSLTVRKMAATKPVVFRAWMATTSTLLAFVLVAAIRSTGAIYVILQQCAHLALTPTRGHSAHLPAPMGWSSRGAHASRKVWQTCLPLLQALVPAPLGIN